MSLLGSGSVHYAGRTGQRPAGPRAKYASGNQVCQRCLQKGHWTYECKNEAVYKPRPSRTQQLKNPKFRQRFLSKEELPPELREASPKAAEKSVDKKRKRRPSPSSSDSSDSSSSDDSSTASGSSSGTSSSSSSGSGSDGSSSGTNSSSSSGSSGSHTSSSSSSDSSDSSGSDSDSGSDHKRHGRRKGSGDRPSKKRRRS